MPLTPEGSKVMSNMNQTYGPDKAKSVFYASINKGKPGSGDWEGTSKKPVAAKKPTGSRSMTGGRR